MTGSGNALVRLLGDPNLPPTTYLEAGIMNLVPEPSTWMLALAGLAALGALQRRRR
jgi:MYXO-CTERM domain-containing protein